MAIFCKPEPVKNHPVLSFCYIAIFTLQKVEFPFLLWLMLWSQTSLVKGWQMLKVFVRMPKVVCRMQSLMLICFPKSNCPKLKKNLLWSCLFIRSWRKKLKLLSNTPKTNFRHLKPTVAEFQIFRAENIEVDICATAGTRPPA